MSIFFLLFSKIAPLYVLILIGFLLGKFLKLKKEFISFLLLYILAPVVFFNGVYTTKIDFATLSLPVLFLSCAQSCV